MPTVYLHMHPAEENISCQLETNRLAFLHLQVHIPIIFYVRKWFFKTMHQLYTSEIPFNLGMHSKNKNNLIAAALI